MKPIAQQPTYPAARTVAVAVLLITLALATPSRAASMDHAPAPAAGTLPLHVMMAQASSTQAPAATSQAPTPATGTKGSRVNRVEARIADLHAKLKITPAQEAQWNAVTQVMRDNAKRMEVLTKARAENAKTMTAVDDLKSYSEIIAAHDEGLKTFIPAFESLYAGMSDEQKKTADDIFRNHSRSHMASKHTAPKSS
jgi:protein CpxP